MLKITRGQENILISVKSHYTINELLAVTERNGFSGDSEFLNIDNLSKDDLLQLLIGNYKVLNTITKLPYRFKVKCGDNEVDTFYCTRVRDQVIVSWLDREDIIKSTLYNYDKVLININSGYWELV